MAKLTEQQQYIRMTETPVAKLVTSLALPTVGGMLVSSIYNITDTFFVSQLGTSASAAVGVVFSIQSLIFQNGQHFRIRIRRNALPKIHFLQ